MLPYAIALSGWVIFVFFITYGYHGYGLTVFRHYFLMDDMPHFYFDLAAFLSPLISSAFGYLVYEKTKFQRNLKQSEAKYVDLYQNAPDGFHSVGSDGTISEVNDTWLKMLGYERQEVIDRKITDFLTEESIETFRANYPELLKRGSITNLDFVFKRKNSTILQVLVNATAVYDSNGNFLHSRSVIRDNTVKKGYENMLKHAAEEWRATFDSMPYGVMLLDDESNMLRANAFIAKLTGIPLKGLPGRKCYEAIHGTNKPVPDCPLLKSSKTNKTEEVEYKDGDRHFKAMSTPILRKHGAPKEYVHSVIDITDVKNKESELIKSRDAFLNMLKDATEDYRELKEIQNNLVLAFANAIDAKSPWTKGHSERVTAYAVSIAKELDLGEGELETLKTASLLHDIGKIGTYDGILNKTGRLTDEEFNLIRLHPGKGADILRPIRQFVGILSIVSAHHERVDGKGYPEGLKGEGIPFLARIIHVADSYDAMTADRPYRAAPGKEFAITELKKHRGMQFDTDVVGAFLRIV